MHFSRTKGGWPRVKKEGWTTRQTTPPSLRGRGLERRQRRLSKRTCKGDAPQNTQCISGVTVRLQPRRTYLLCVHYHLSSSEKMCTNIFCLPSGLRSQNYLPLALLLQQIYDVGLERQTKSRVNSVSLQSEVSLAAPPNSQLELRLFIIPKACSL